MIRLYLSLIVVALAYPLVIFAFAQGQAAQKATLVGAFTVSATLLVGLPLAIWCVRNGRLRFWQAVLAGALAGAVSVGLVLLDGTQKMVLASHLLLPLATMGAIHGAAFWLLGVFKNDALRRA